MATKITATGSTDAELIKECEKQTECGKCQPGIIWTNPPGGSQTTLDETTIAIIVDVGNQGAIRIFKKSDEEYVDGVGTPRNGALVIVPWNKDWYYSAVGQLRVGHIRKA